MLDATASFGLENHKLADVFSYSSCKGLFGLTELVLSHMIMSQK